MSAPLRLTPARAARERRLADLLGGGPVPERVRHALDEARVQGSLELAGIAEDAAAVAAARRGERPESAAAALFQALRAVDPAAPYTTHALAAWHQALLPGAGYRQQELHRADGPPPAPARFVESRLAILEQWLGTESGGELRPAQAGALVLARLTEILPFAQANGRVARLATDHVMVRAGARPPLLRGADQPRLRAVLGAAWQLQTEPLAALLEEASDRALEVMIGALSAS